MKISEFAAKYNVSNDTVRYYMDLNLLIPEKKGGHYHFDKSCEDQIKEVLRLKEMNFSLQEIKEIFNFKRIGKLTSYQQNKYYQGLYHRKLEEVQAQITGLKKAKERIEETINNLNTKSEVKRVKIGVDLSILSFLVCPICQRDLRLSAEKVKDNQVIEGSLNCKCGESLKIEEGILYTEHTEINENSSQSDHIEKYIKNTDPEFIDKSYQSLEWLKKQLELEDLTGKVLLEPGSGYGHFLRQVYDDLSEEAVYICVDNNPQVNRYLKRYLEMSGRRAKILFITSNLPVLPIKEGLVDILVDFTGTSCYSFKNEGFLPELINEYLKDDLIFLAVFIVYYKFGPNNIVSDNYRHNFIQENIKNKINDLGFEFTEETRSEIEKIEKSMGKYEDFAQPGDKIFSYQIKAKRWS